MATSGTHTWTLSADDVLREASERLGGEPILGNEVESALRSLNIVITDCLNRGVLLFQLEEALVTVSVSQGTYTLPVSTVDVLQMSLRRNNVDMKMERIGFAQYLQIANKFQTSRPVKYFIDRRYTSPVVYLWPLPENSTDAMYMWRARRIQDVTQLNQDFGIPFRFMPVLAAGLAYHISVKRTGIPPERIALLQGQYMEALAGAKGEDRDRGDLQIRPKLKSI